MKKLNKRKTDSLLVIFLSELVGTGFLMFFGCLGTFGAVDEWKTVSSIQGSFVWGCLIASIIVAIGHLSNAHLNPCVTLCAFLLGHISFLKAAVYLLAQILGTLLGMYTLKISVPDMLYSIYNTNAGACGFCSTTVHPSLSLPQAFILEFLATSLLIFVVCSVWDPCNAKLNDSTAIKFGLFIIVISLSAGPFTGGSMNPARSLAPAIVNNGWKNQWLYWVAPLSGSTFTTLFYRYLFLGESEENDLSEDTVNADQTSAMLKDGGVNELRQMA